MPKIAAIILAAGASSRFGRAKQLLRIADKSLIRRMVDEAREARSSPVIVVTGAGSVEINRELAPSPAISIGNPDWYRGIGTSIRRGIRHLVDNFRDVDAAVLLVCDQPFADSKTIRNLISLREQTKKPIVACSYAHTLGVPALFDRSLFHELLAIDDSCGGKPVILRDPERVAEFPFPEAEIDIDTEEQWNQIQRVTVPRKTSAA